MFDYYINIIFWSQEINGRIGLTALS